MKLYQELIEDLDAHGVRLAIFGLLTVRGQATVLFRLAQRLGKKFGIAGDLMTQWNHFATGCDVSWKAQVGPGLKLYHPTGVVIGPWVVMGSGCELQQGVTLGGSGFGMQRGEADPSPVVGSRVKFGSGAKAFGRISIGDGTVLGANCVLVHDTAPETIVIGGLSQEQRKNMQTSVCTRSKD